MNGVVRTLYEMYLAEIWRFIDTPLLLLTPKLEMLGRGGVPDRGRLYVLWTHALANRTQLLSQTNQDWSLENFG